MTRLLGRILLVLAVTGGAFAAAVWFTRPAGTDLDTVLDRDDTEIASSTTTTTKPVEEVSTGEPTDTTSPDSGDEAPRFDPVDGQFRFEPPGDWFVALDEATDPRVAVGRLRRFGDIEMADRIEAEVEADRQRELQGLWVNTTTREIIAMSEIAAWGAPLATMAQTIAEEDYTDTEPRRDEFAGAEAWIIEPDNDDTLLLTRTNPVTIWIVEFPDSAAPTVYEHLTFEVLVDAPEH